MKNQIVQRVCDTLLSTVIILAVVSCSFRFIPTNKPPEPKKMIVEAPVGIVHGIIIVVQWIMGGGGGGQKGGSSKSPVGTPN